MSIFRKSHFKTIHVESFTTIHLHGPLFWTTFSVPLHTQDYRRWKGREAYAVSTTWFIENWHLNMECLAAFDLKLNRFLFMYPILLCIASEISTITEWAERTTSSQNVLISERRWIDNSKNNLIFLRTWDTVWCLRWLCWLLRRETQ